MTMRRGRALLLAGCLMLAACGAPAPEEIVTETVVPVTTAAAATGTIRAVVSATGLVVPAPGADLIVTAPEAARIAEMPKAEGDTVKRGDLLVRFDIPSLAAGTAGRTAEVERARARLQNAEAARTRAHDLFDRGVAARKEVEDADRELLDAQAAVAEAGAGRAASQALASRALVRATFDGVVAKRAHNPGDLVDASATDVVLRVIDPRRLEVSAAIPLADVPRLTLGAAARIVGGNGEDPPPLKVIARPAVVEAGAATASARLAFTAPPGFAVGTPVQLRIDAEEHSAAVIVPASAIVHEGEETSVFVATDGKAVRRPVEVGLTDGERTEIVSGLKAGETVIVTGQSGLPDGAAISVTAADK